MSHIQQINLYQRDSQRKISGWLNPYLLTTALSLLMLALISGWDYLTLNQDQDHQRSLEKQLQQVDSRLQTLQSQFPDQHPNPALSQEVDEWQSRYQSLSQVLALLNDDHSDRSQGFSRYLLALANQADSQVWLTRIQIDVTQNDIALQGATRSPDRIAALLQSLQNTQAFKGRRFAQLSIQPAEQASEVVQFSVNSKHDATAVTQPGTGHEQKH